MQIYGFHPVREALRTRPATIRRVRIVAGRTGKRRAEIEDLCRRHGIECSEVGEAEVEGKVRAVHNGFIADTETSTADATLRHRDTDFVVLLEDIQDPRNLGALVRICDGAGVGRILLRDRGSSPVTPTVVKASAGATEWTEVERMTNSGNEIARLKKDGFWIYGADGAGKPPWEIDLSGRVVLCLGGEEKGLRKRTRSLCDELVGLPMRGGVESLNVSAAAAAILYEIVRQRS